MKRYQSGLRHDYKDPIFTTPAVRAQRPWSLFVLGLSAPIAVVGLLVKSPSASVPAMPPSSERVLEALAVDVTPFGAPLAIDYATASSLRPFPAPGSAAIDAASLLEEAAASMLELVVTPGDTLERLFRRHGLSLGDLAAMVRLDDAADYLKRLQPGDKIQVDHRDGRVMRMLRQIDNVRLLSIARAENGFAAETVELPLDVRERVAHGELTEDRPSPWLVGSQAGMSDTVIANAFGIFQWDIDFMQEVRVGDSFTVIYEEHWRDGEKLGDGPIIAAEFVNRGTTYRAARYTDAIGRTDYFTPEGLSVRKAFLRAPLAFNRVSSNFDPNRRHPVLNTVRAHRGVDYAAPTGTPVKAAGDGKIIERGVSGGYGNVVVIQHGGNITTLYAHLSRFGSYKVGQRVRQGQVIGYVGATGLATGPHLHYEYRIDGAHRNPRTVPLPPADPVPAEYRPHFEQMTATLWERLDAYQRTRYANAAAN